MPDMTYDEKEVLIAPGESVLFYSDGLVEAHNIRREMFGFQHLRELVMSHADGGTMVDFLLEELAAFTGQDWEQEDDVTLMTLEREGESDTQFTTPQKGEWMDKAGWRTLTQFSLPSERGNERQAMEQVAEAVKDLNLPATRLERLKTAVSEATMNAIEHGNNFRPEIEAFIQVLASEDTLKVLITDQGGGQPIPEANNPDLDAKLAGLQSPRGWGLFLIKNMVDGLRVISDETHHTVEMTFNLKGDPNERKAA
jgi:anti-sigma regulatory factor (Ser/Thr protein kinase)